MGEYGLESPWNDNAIKGVSRFLDKVYNLHDKVISGDNYTNELEVMINKTIKKVSEDYENMKYNTAISELMKLTNAFANSEKITKADYLVLIKLLNPVAPHLAEELNSLIGNKETLVFASFPTYDDEKIVDDVLEIAVQVNGKLRDSIKVKKDEDKKVVEETALASVNVKRHIEGKEIVKVIVVANRIVNIVVK